MITTSSSQKNIGQMISVPKLAELDKLLDDDKKNELRCLATVQKLRNEMYTAFRGNTAIAKFFVQNFPSLDKNAGELMTVKNYLLEKISYHYSDLCIDQARQSKQFSKELKKVAITNGTELAVDSADYMTILHEVKAKLMKNKVKNNFETKLITN
jgi:choline kinase